MRKRVAEHPHREAFFRTRNWKSDELTVGEAGTFWLVKTDQIHIQGRYWKNASTPELTSLGALAISGPFMKGNSLVVRNLNGEVTYNDEAILQFIPSQFKNDIVQATYSDDAEIIHNGHRGAGVDISLPMGLHLTVNRWKQNLAAKITMCGAPDAPSQGQCGNNNKDVADDSPLILLGNFNRKLAREEIIFPDGLNHDKVSLLTQAAKRPRIGDLVRIVSTVNTRDNFASGIAQQFRITRDEHEEPPYAVDGSDSDAWLYSEDVELA